MGWPEFAPNPDGPPTEHGGWPFSLGRWLFGRGASPKDAQKPTEPIARFRNVCISRETGAGGGTIARMVAARLGWKAYDNEILEAISQRMGLSPEEVQSLDELAPSAVQDWILPLREEYYAPQEAYLDHLAKLIEAIGRSGNAIIVGRGANFMLARSEILSVRIIAPIKARAARLAERTGISVRTAKRAAYDLDKRRNQFIRTMHRVDQADPHNYDLVLDSDRLGVTIASEIIIRAIEAGQPPKVSVANAETE